MITGQGNSLCQFAMDTRTRPNTNFTWTSFVNSLCTAYTVQSTHNVGAPFFSAPKVCTSAQRIDIDWCISKCLYNWLGFFVVGISSLHRIRCVAVIAVDIHACSMQHKVDYPIPNTYRYIFSILWGKKIALLSSVHRPTSFGNYNLRCSIFQTINSSHKARYGRWIEFSSWPRGHIVVESWFALKMVIRISSKGGAILTSNVETLLALPANTLTTDRFRLNHRVFLAVKLVPPLLGRPRPMETMVLPHWTNYRAVARWECFVLCWLYYPKFCDQKQIRLQFVRRMNRVVVNPPLCQSNWSWLPFDWTVCDQSVPFPMAV